MKFAFYDLETGGLDPTKNPILELYMCIEVGGNILGEFHQHVQWLEGHGLEVDDAALTANGLDRATLSSEARIPPTILVSQLTAFARQFVRTNDKADKLTLVGYNSAGFDRLFLQAAYKRHAAPWDFPQHFQWPDLDVAVLARYFFGAEWAILPGRKLGDVAACLGLTVDDKQLHGAKYDVNLTRQIYHKINNLLRAEKADFLLP